MAPQYPQQQQLKRRPPKEAGPESPDDKVNNQPVENINDRSPQQAKRDATRGPTASAQSSKTDKAY